MPTIYGILGYSFLQNKLFNNYVLILSDVHNKMEYCNKSSINIAVWLSNKLDTLEILLEEVDNSNNLILQSLWNSSIHTKQLKELFIKNSKIIHGIDIRPTLIPFSWELLENNIIDITLKNYLQIIDSFFINNNIKLSNIKILYHFNLIKKEYIKFKLKLIKYNYYDKQLYYIYKNNINILNSVNTLLDNIMEWFTIDKLYRSKKNVIIHIGLFHSERILYLLLNFYKYKLISMKGINHINQTHTKNKYKKLYYNTYYNRFHIIIDFIL